MICKNCGDKFSIITVINGKSRNLSKRKYCLKCSPFGKHNTKSYGYIKKTNTERSCSLCNKSYKRKGRFCNSCLANRRRFSLKKMLVEYKGGRCEVCGYDKCLGALTFHHKNPSDKLFTISGSHSKSADFLYKEVDKCSLLCNNCHAELHWNEHSESRERFLSVLSSNP